MGVDFASDDLGRVYNDRTVSDDWKRWCEDTLDPKGKDVVDLGCGGGIYSRGFAALGAASVTGIDPSPQYIKEALAAGGPGMRFLSGSAAATGLDDASAGIVFHRAVIHHMDEKNQAAGAHEMFRILRPGGVALVQDRTIEDVISDHPDHWVRATLFKEYPHLIEVERARRPSAGTYTAMLKDAGFKAVALVSYSETRRIYGSFAELEQDLMARKGKSILFELTDDELAGFCQVLAAQAPPAPFREADQWTVWLARKPA